MQFCPNKKGILCRFHLSHSGEGHSDLGKMEVQFKERQQDVELLGGEKLADAIQPNSE
jgi:hypothetical protein